MTRYVGLIDHDKAGYGVIFPDAPGANAMGSSVDEALENAVEALTDWMAGELEDGRPMPKARSLAVVQRDKDVAKALSAGSVIAMVPLIPPGGKAVRANLSLDASLLHAIDEAAKRHGVTRSAFLAAAAREKIVAGA